MSFASSMGVVLCLSSLLVNVVVAVEIDAAERNAAFIGYQEKAGPAITFKNFVMTTAYGKIRIKPRPDVSPKIVDMVLKLAEQKTCPSCKFYRHEPAPKNFGQSLFFGPPYALLQGSLGNMKDTPPFEGSPEIKKGDVCIIPNSKEFFIATAGHEEWGHSHSVWGHIADDASWAVIDNVPLEPFTTITDSGNITTRWLTPNVTTPFTLTTE